MEPVCQYKLCTKQKYNRDPTSTLVKLYKRKVTPLLSTFTELPFLGKELFHSERLTKLLVFLSLVLPPFVFLGFKIREKIKPHQVFIEVQSMSVRD